MGGYLAEKLLQRKKTGPENKTRIKLDNLNVFRS